MTTVRALPDSIASRVQSMPHATSWFNGTSGQRRSQAVPSRIIRFWNTAVRVRWMRSGFPADMPLQSLVRIASG